jgi:threonine dehydrogenase-like Zn-dependent dehydrogenase
VLRIEVFPERSNDHACHGYARAARRPLRTDPKIFKPTNAIIKLAATCICGSDLWPYRGLQPSDGPAHLGHEYCGIVVEVGSEVRTVRPGQLVVDSSACPTTPARTASLAFTPPASSASS